MEILYLQIYENVRDVVKFQIASENLLHQNVQETGQLMRRCSVSTGTQGFPLSLLHTGSNSFIYLVGETLQS